MYKLKDTVDLEQLRKYGFRPGNEYDDYKRCICNDYEYDNWWLISLDSKGAVRYADYDEDQPMWCVQVRDDMTLWIECVPSFSYSISIYDMEHMFHALYNMIADGIIEDTLNENE